MTRHFILCFLLAAVLWAAFGSSMKLSFFNDDYFHLTLLGSAKTSLWDIRFNSFSTSTLDKSLVRNSLPWWYEASFRFNYFRPIPTLFFFLEYALWGKNPAWYHFTAVLFHVICALLFYWLAVLLGVRPTYAFLGALAAGLHTNHLFTVNWICGIDTTLGAFFLALTLLLCDVSLRKTREPRARRCLLAFSFIAFVLGVLSKESLIMTPFLLLALTWLRVTQRKEDFAGEKRYGPFVGLLPFFFFSLCYVVWYRAAGHGVSLTYFLLSPEKGFAGNLASMGKNLYLYLASLIFYIPPDFKETQAFLMSPGFLLLAIITLGLGAGVIFWKRGVFHAFPSLWFFLAWTLIFFITPLGFSPQGRLLNLSTVGFCLFIATFLQGLIDRGMRKVWGILLRAGYLLYFILLPFWIAITVIGLTLNQDVKVHMELERIVTDMETSLPRNSTIFLLNAPKYYNTALANVVHTFYHPETTTKVYVLGNAERPPEINRIGKNTFCAFNPEGLMVLGPPLPEIPFGEGRVSYMPSFKAEQKRLVRGIPAEVCFEFPEALDTPHYLFLSFDKENPRKIDFSDNTSQ